MSDSNDSTVQLQSWLDRMRTGDDAARWQLIQHAQGRLERLARNKLRSFSRDRRLEETGAVLNEANIRLERALAKVQPETVLQFFKLASMHIRWALIDMARRDRETGMPTPGTGVSGDQLEPIDSATGAVTKAHRTELHDQVQGLPEKEREVVDLLFYHGLRQAEAAAILRVSERTVKRIWRDARLRLGASLGGESIES